jgi:hypothetical protein
VSPVPILLDDSIIGEREKFLLYGNPGSGKTFAAGTMPGHIYFLIFGGSNELKTLRSKHFREKHPRKEGMVHYDFIKESLGKRGIFQSANAFDWACDRLDEAIAAEVAGDFRFDSIVVDAATGLRKYAMNKAIELTYDLAKSPDKTALKRLRDHGVVVPQDQDWGMEQSLVEKFLNWCFELDKHFCLITHEWNAEKHDRGTRETTITAIKPLFTGKHRNEIPQMFDNVWRMKVEGAEKARIFTAQTVGDEKVDAKTRLGGILDIEWRNPNLEEAIKKFQAYAKSASGAN